MIVSWERRERSSTPDATTRTPGRSVGRRRDARQRRAGKPLFSWVGDELAACEARLREVARRMREVPTTRHHGDRVLETCARLEEIAEDFADADHNGNG